MKITIYCWSTRADRILGLPGYLLRARSFLSGIPAQAGVPFLCHAEHNELPSLNHRGNHVPSDSANAAINRDSGLNARYGGRVATWERKARWPAYRPLRRPAGPVRDRLRRQPRRHSARRRQPRCRGRPSRTQPRPFQQPAGRHLHLGRELLGRRQLRDCGRPEERDPALGWRPLVQDRHAQSRDRSRRPQQPQRRRVHVGPQLLGRRQLRPLRRRAAEPGAALGRHQAGPASPLPTRACPGAAHTA